MIISNAAPAAPVQPGAQSTTKAAAPAEAATSKAADAKPGTQGIKRLSGDAATVVLTEQGAADKMAKTPAKAPPKLDLHGQDLRAVDLSKLDLRGADLTGVDLTGKDLSGIDMSGAKLTGAKLDGAKFYNTNLRSVDAAGASFAKATFDYTDLANGNFAGAKFAGTRLGDPEWDLKTPIDFTNKLRGDINGANFAKADFSNATFATFGLVRNCNFSGSRFDNARIPYASFVGGSMKDASFQHFSGKIAICESDASNVDFRNIDNAGVCIQLSKTDGATFAGSKVRLSFLGVDLRNVDLTVKDKDLRKTSFDDCVMDGMKFTGYDFSGAEFGCSGPSIASPYISGKAADPSNMVAGVDFHGAKFAGAQFFNFDMRAALLDAGAFRGATVHNWLDISKHIDTADYDINTLFRNIWPEWTARMQFSHPI